MVSRGCRRSIACWRNGLDSDYADGAGGIQLPLLLYAASILRNELVPTAQIQSLLRSRLLDPRSTNWPGPLAKLVLREFDEHSLAESNAPKRDYPPDRKWKLQFYELLLSIELGDQSPSQGKSVMGTMSELIDPGWSTLRNFLALLWCEEFFLARYEAGMPQLGK